MMKRLALLLMILVMATPVITAAQNPWPELVKKLVTQVPRVEMRTGAKVGTCSAVVFEIDAEGIAHALTAAHCVSHSPDTEFDLTLNGRNARVIQTNRIIDLAIVQFRAKGETAAITLAPSAPPNGTAVAVAGYAFGVEEIVFQFGHIAQSYNKETKTIWINGDLIFGDSGGSIVDDQGRLVGVTSSVFHDGPAHIGGAVPVDIIHDFIDDYKSQLRKAKK